jgi:hypothetical protein
MTHRFLAWLTSLAAWAIFSLYWFYVRALAAIGAFLPPALLILASLALIAGLI